MCMVINLNYYKVLCMEEIIFSVWVKYDISLVMIILWLWILLNKEDFVRLLCVMFRKVSMLLKV